MLLSLNNPTSRIFPGWESHIQPMPRNISQTAHLANLQAPSFHTFTTSWYFTLMPISSQIKSLYYNYCIATRDWELDWIQRYTKSSTQYTQNYTHIRTFRPEVTDSSKRIKNKIIFEPTNINISHRIFLCHQKATNFLSKQVTETVIACRLVYCHAAVCIFAIYLQNNNLSKKLSEITWDDSLSLQNQTINSHFTHQRKRLTRVDAKYNCRPHMHVQIWSRGLPVFTIS